jgi:hypothetical protein
LISTSGARIETTAPGHYEEPEERSARNGFYRVFRCNSTASSDVSTSLSDVSLGGKGAPFEPLIFSSAQASDTSDRLFCSPTTIECAVSNQYVLLGDRI